MSCALIRLHQQLATLPATMLSAEVVVHPSGTMYALCETHLCLPTPPHSHCLQAAGLDHPAGTLYALPLLNIPASQLDLGLEWELPGGRSPDDHHLFPMDVPAEGRQGPISLVDHYKSFALHVSMQAVIGAPRAWVSQPQLCPAASMSQSHARLSWGCSGHARALLCTL